MPVKTTTTRHVRYDSGDASLTVDLDAPDAVRVQATNTGGGYSAGVLYMPYDEFVTFADAVRLAHAAAVREGC